MWMLLPAISLAIVHIAGDNVGVMPDAAANAGSSIFLVTILAYMVLGSILTGLSAWIGAHSGLELGVLVTRKFGCRGKQLLALSILAISIPASALTGGYFAGWLLHSLTGIPYQLATALSLLMFILFAAGYWEDVVAISSYGSLLLVPAVLLLIICQGGTVFEVSLRTDSIDWWLIFAVLSYNTGGMRPVLVAEAAAYLAKKGRSAVCLAVVAKVVEGLITLIMAQVVISAGTHGPLALSEAAAKLLGTKGGVLFDCILLCVFINTMMPAMLVNARQTASLTGLGSCQSLIIAGLAVYAVTFLDYQVVLHIMSVTGLLMVGFILYIVYFLHKHRVNL